MGSPMHNRQSWEDVIESGRYKVRPENDVFIGEPLKYDGTSGAGGVPAYTNYIYVDGYTDMDGYERCLGVSDDQIMMASGSMYEALKHIEFRGFRRDVSMVIHGDRVMINKATGYLAFNNDVVAPYPGGFQPWFPGMCSLGKVKQGPIAFNGKGLIMIDVKYYWPGNWPEDGDPWEWEEGPFN